MTGARLVNAVRPEEAGGAFASYGGSGFVAGVILAEPAGSGTAAVEADPSLLAAPDPHGRTATAERRSSLPVDPLSARHGSDDLDFRTVDYGNTRAAERTAAEERLRGDGWTVPDGIMPGTEIFDESPAAFKSGGGAGAVHGAPDPAGDIDGETLPAAPSELVVPRSTPPESTSDAVPDDLTRIKGIGPSIERLLFDKGILSFDQMANWTDVEMRWADDLIGFRGRVAREKWVEQARAFSRKTSLG